MCTILVKSLNRRPLRYYELALTKLLNNMKLISTTQKSDILKRPKHDSANKMNPENRF